MSRWSRAKHMAKALAPWVAAAEVEIIARLQSGSVLDKKALGLVALTSYQVYRTSNGVKPKPKPTDSKASVTRSNASPEQEVLPSPPTPRSGTTPREIPKTNTSPSTEEVREPWVSSTATT